MNEANDPIEQGWPDLWLDYNKYQQHLNLVLSSICQDEPPADLSLVI